MGIYDKLFPPKIITMANGKTVAKPRSRAPLAVFILLALTDVYKRQAHLLYTPR